MINFEELTGICILILTMVAAIISLILTLEYVRKNRATRYDSIEKTAIIDEQRRHYEELIYKLQSDLAQNERRWKDVNHLIINGQASSEVSLDSTSRKTVISQSFFENLGIDLEEVSIENKSVFVLTPFSDRETQTFHTIKKICGDVDLKCTRGDEVYRDNNILSHIITSILNANIIIANINGRNPNVFYELGICHAIGKPVIVISMTKSDLPFDISAKNIIFYNSDADLQEKLKNELLKIFINTSN